MVTLKYFLQWVVYENKSPRAINNSFICTLKEVLECSWTLILTLHEKETQMFEDSGCIVHFTCKLLNLVPLFLSRIDCTGTDLGFQILTQKKTVSIKVMCVRKLNFISMTSPAFKI
jgi:hypothetical protein